ncbi:MAG: hypothetical protein KAW14_07980 [Candidatus Aegiribacteria sp.]|nr:hypothetical protein [Candidatus Aegiribacteria sp.]
MIRIYIPKILDFYDKDVDSRRHSNSIKAISGEEMGLALLKHYWESSGAKLGTIEYPCTTGRRKGPRLDGWLKVQEKKQVVLYQIEVKSWSIHGICDRGKYNILLNNANTEQLKDFRIKRWEDYWDSSQNRFKASQLDKVLVKMKYKGEKNFKSQKALACLWVSIHPEGKSEVMFTVPCKSEHFDEVTIFSMSNYLRECYANGTKELEIETPDLSARMSHLNEMFTQL